MNYDALLTKLEATYRRQVEAAEATRQHIEAIKALKNADQPDLPLKQPKK